MQPLPLLFSVVTATTAASAVASVKQIGKRAVFPHAVNNGYKYGRTATCKNALDAVAAATCRKQ